MDKFTNIWFTIENNFGCLAYFDWQEHTGNMLSILEQYLLSTDELAVSYPCPDFEDEGCPREIINYKGQILAVCCNYEKPGDCETIKLTKKDITHYKIDWYKLTKILASLFKFEHNYFKLNNFIHTYQVGEFALEFKRFPVYMIISCPAEKFEQIIFKLTKSHGDNKFILILFTYKFIPQNIVASLKAENNLILCLDDLLKWRKDNSLTLKFNREEIFQDFKNKHTDNNNLSFFAMPLNSSWEDIIIKFTNRHVVEIQCKTVTQIVSYTHMNMANQNDSPNKQWLALEIFAENKGFIHARTSFAEKSIKKQKSLLSKRLRDKHSVSFVTLDYFQNLMLDVLF